MKATSKTSCLSTPIGFLFFFICLAFFTSCKTPVSDQTIAQKIKQANYCTVKSDCVDIGPQCPFGCNILVNKHHAKQIKHLLSASKAVCEYKCMQLKNYDCVNQVCVPDYAEHN